MKINDSHPKLPPSGKPYHLLDMDEVQSFKYYQKNGGRLGVSVSLKRISTDHAGVQLIVIVKAISGEVTVDRDNIIQALADLHSSHADSNYKNKLIEINAEKLWQLYEVSTKHEITLSHQYTDEKLIEVDNGMFIPKPKTLVGKLKFLFGMY